LNGIFSRNKLFDTVYYIGAQGLPELERDFHVEDVTTMTIFESYEDYLVDGWPDFTRDFCE